MIFFGLRRNKEELAKQIEALKLAWPELKKRIKEQIFNFEQDLWEY